MADNINLLPDQKPAQSSAAKQNEMIRNVSIVALILTIVAVAGILGANLVMSRSLDSLGQEIVDAESEVNSYKDVEGVFRSVAARIKTSEEFMGQQHHYSRLVAKIGDSIPGGVHLTELSVTSGNEVTLSGSAASYGDISGFQTKLRLAQDDNKRQYFLNPVVSRIGRETASDPIDFGMTFNVDQSLITSQASE